MAFRFSLATLLRMREITEQREERLLGQIQNQIAQTRQTIQDIARQRESIIASRERCLAQSASAVDLMESYAQLEALKKLEASTNEQLAKLITLRDHQMKVYQAAHRDSELLSGMRDDQKEAFFREQVKREQSALDDNFNSRRSLN